MSALKLAAGMGRLGTESVFDMLARATELEAQGKPIIHLSIGQPDFKTPPHVVEAAIRALKDGHHGYTPTPGVRAVREAVAADVALRRGVSVDPAQVIVVPGGKVTMFFAIAMFGEPGAEILYPNPGFPIYESLIKWTGATPVPMRLTEASGFAFSADEVLAQITPRTRLLIVNTPANPTGGVVPKAELDRLAAGLERHPHVAILSDEIYARMLYDGHAHVSLLSYPAIRDRVILLDGWSKTYAMTGWRIGYAAGPVALIRAMGTVQSQSTSNPCSIAQYAALEALTGPQDFLATNRATFQRRRDLVVAMLNAAPGITCPTPEGAFYVYPDISGCIGKTSAGGVVIADDEAFATALLEETGVAVVFGAAFGLSPNFRVSYATSDAALHEACTRIQTFCAGLR